MQRFSQLAAVIVTGLLVVAVLACGGSNEPTDGRSSERATARPPLAETSPDTDREALIALYNATGGPDWKINGNWLTDEPIHSWDGVTTSDGRVIVIALPNNRLTGELPPELWDLSALEELYLGVNQLTGKIPPELGNLTNLTAIDLDSNQLTGELPPELWDLSNLRILDLGDNQLTGEVPPELGNLTRLAYLNLKNNQLTGELPPELGNLYGLTKLILNNNQLTGEIPSELGNLTNLIGIDLTQNQLTGCAPEGLEGFDYVGLPSCIAPLGTLPRTPAAMVDDSPTPPPMLDPTATPLPTARPVVTTSPTATPRATKSALTATPVPTPKPTRVPAATPMPTATAIPTPTLMPTPTRVPTVAPMPTATPASTARPTGTPEEESSISTFPWYRDGLYGYEIHVANGLQHIEREHPSTARTVLDLPWVVDGPNDNEARALASFLHIPEKDSSLLQTLVGFPWFTDGLTEIEADVLILIGRINMEYSSQAERVAGFPWIADGISPHEESFVLRIQNLLRNVGVNASDNQYVAQRVLALPWLADDFTEHGYTLISQYLSWVVGWVDLELSDSVLESPLFDVSDGEVKPLQAAAMTVVRSLIRRGRLEELLGQPWFQDGLTEEELALITVLTGRLDEEEVFQGFIKGGDVVHSETITLPFTGELKLFVISRFPLDPDSGILEFMRSSVEHIEAAVGEPWPRDFAILVVEPTARTDVTHYFIISNTGLGSNIPHEFAHHYFSSGEVNKWLAEGAATFLERNPFSKSAEQNRSLYDAVKRGCASADGRITNGSASSRATHRDQAITGGSSSGRNEYCEYTIGEAFWLGMYLSLGRDIVSTYLGELYKAGEANRAEVHHALTDGQVYQVLLSNTPPEKRAQFRELWQRLYGRDMEVTHSGDRNALVAIVQANRRDPSWSGYDNWLTDAPISQWENVVTNDSGRVISLDLSFRQLQMRVPPELGNLSMLEELYLNRTDFTGAIPAELGSLSRLERLYLADTELTGCIPEGLRRVPHNDFDEAGLPFC